MRFKSVITLRRSGVYFRKEAQRFPRLVFLDQLVRRDVAFFFEDSRDLRFSFEVGMSRGVARLGLRCESVSKSR